jgi:colanic acid/amylovoran biosynthesis glycosyltransferase
VLITNHYPYGIGEAFLENEIGFLTRHFNKVLILSKDNTATTLRTDNTDFVFERIPLRSNLPEKIFSLLLFLRYGKRAAGYVWDEVRYLRLRRRKLTFKIVRKIFHDLFKALVLSRHIGRNIKKHKLGSRLVLYSYWLTSSALSTTFVRPGNHSIYRISRAHRIDLYEEEHPDKYLTFRRTLATALDKIFAVSNHGMNYLRDQLPGVSTSVTVSRIGTRDPLILPQKKAKQFVVVSCSFLIPVKRVHLIAEALSLTRALPVHWIHFGDGPLRHSLEKTSAETLGRLPGIRFEFRGAIKNQDLIRFYQQNFVDLFVSSSLSEGIPVTMMEAQSFGIPIVAPDVGGVAEIVNDDTGILLPAGATAAEIAKAIETLLNLPEKQLDLLRAKARKQWELRYNAEKNFQDFLAILDQNFN